MLLKNGLVVTTSDWICINILAMGQIVHCRWQQGKRWSQKPPIRIGRACLSQWRIWGLISWKFRFVEHGREWWEWTIPRDCSSTRCAHLFSRFISRTSSGVSFLFCRFFPSRSFPWTSSGVSILLFSRFFPWTSSVVSFLFSRFFPYSGVSHRVSSFWFWASRTKS